MEHDPRSLAVLVALDDLLGSAVAEELTIQAAVADRKEIVMQSIDHSAVLLAADIDEAVDFANAFAPEHLEIITIDPMGVLRNIRHAGSVFLGPYTPVAACDYASGTNHVLPTSGYARVLSGLNVDHFTKKISVQMITDEGLLELEEAVTTLAEAEGPCRVCEKEAGAKGLRFGCDPWTTAQSSWLGEWMQLWTSPMPSRRSTRRS